MSGHVRSVVTHGATGILVDIECTFSNSLPGIVIVGSAAKSVDEAKERIRAAFSSSTVQLPRKRVTINLAPADLPKNDSGIDLAMAVAIVHASNQIKLAHADKTVFLGELGLDGSLRPIRGLIGKILTARENGVTDFYIPSQNLEQALLVPHIRVHGVSSLKEVITLLDGSAHSKPVETGEGILQHSLEKQTIHPFEDVVGQLAAKRALEVAAAGGHNVMFSGPPGTGKTMLAKCLPDLLPGLSHEEIIEVSQLHSLVDSAFDKLTTARPFRAPHHSASHVAITGGGHNLRPGEVSLSHRGVLFLDEFPEFNRQTIEALRQPLEDRTISVTRAKDSVTYPADFILIATANPCPCGFYGSRKSCICQPYQIQRYQQRLSGPIIDRIDLFANVHEVDHERLLHTQTTDDKAILQRITQARAAQKERFGSPSKLNANMNNKELKQLALLTAEAKTILDAAAQKLELSARSYMRSIKLARTIADLANSQSIEPGHITEALQFRPQNTAF